MAWVTIFVTETTIFVNVHLMGYYVQAYTNSVCRANTISTVYVDRLDISIQHNKYS